MTRRNISVGGGCAAVALALVACFYPTHVLFALMILAGLGFLVGLAGTHLRRRFRVGLIAANVALGLAAVLGIHALHTRAATAANIQAFAQQAREVESDLDQNCYLNAERRATALRSNASVPNTEKQAVQLYLDRWLKDHYGRLNENERGLLTALFEHFGERTNSNVLRFSALHLDGGTLQLCAVCDTPRTGPAPENFDRCVRIKTGPERESPQTSGDPAIPQAVALIRFARDRVPDITHFDLSLTGAACGHTWSLDSEALERVLAGDIAPLSNSRAR